jgi:hypothetical protein
MLPPFIIQQIRRREEDSRRQREQEQPRLEIPVDSFPEAPKSPPRSREEAPERGVIILDLG